MSLKDRLHTKNTRFQSQPTEHSEAVHSDFSSLKDKLSSLLWEKIHSTPMWGNYSTEQQKELIKQFAKNQLTNNFVSAELNKTETDKLINEIIQETKGYGPLDSLLNDPEISEIFVNGANNVFVEKNAKLCKSEVVFKNTQQLKIIMDKFLATVGRKINEKTPVVQVSLPDGTYINAVIEPFSINGPCLTIRKFKQNAQTFEDLIRQGTMTKEISEVLSAAVKAKLNIVISSSQNSEKINLLNTLCAQIPNEQRIITIEDYPLLSLSQENVVRLETRAFTGEAQQISSKDLLSTALRMHPDRLILSQCAGAEVFELVQAINAGFEGVLTTVHANSPKEALLKLEKMSNTQVASLIDMIIQLDTMQDGSLKITSISEIKDSNTNPLQEIFRFEKTGFENSKVIGHHCSTGIKPTFLNKIKSTAPEYFNKERKHTTFNEGPKLKTTSFNQRISK